MPKRITTAFVATVLLAGLCFAQQGRGPRRMGAGNGQPPDPAAMIQMHVDRLATLLSLTDAQKTKATTIFTDVQTASQSIRASLQTAHQSLADAIKKNDTGSIDSLAMTIGNATGQLTAIQAKSDAAFYAILTADQKAKYDSMPRGGPRGGFGPGPFGRPPQGGQGQ